MLRMYTCKCELLRSTIDAQKRKVSVAWNANFNTNCEQMQMLMVVQYSFSSPVFKWHGLVSKEKESETDWRNKEVERRWTECKRIEWVKMKSVSLLFAYSFNMVQQIINIAWATFSLKWNEFKVEENRLFLKPILKMSGSVWLMNYTRSTLFVRKFHVISSFHKCVCDASNYCLKYTFTSLLPMAQSALNEENTHMNSYYKNLTNFPDVNICVSACMSVLLSFHVPNFFGP